MGVSEEGDLLDFPLLKYNQYEMVWGGVSLKGLIPKVAPVWQDDPACIHRDKVAIEACSVFPKRIPHERQALFASHQKMYEGIEMILKVQAVAATSISVESYVESLVSTYEHHFYKKMESGGRHY